MREGGFAVYAGLVDGGVRARLLDEAWNLASASVESRVAVSDGEEGRGGCPARKFLSGPGGPAQQAFYRSPGVLCFLRTITHRSLERTGEAGTYSYYARPGDFLALHRDIVTCDVAVITCLSDSPDTRTGGALALYPDRIFEPLSAIRATVPQGARYVRLEPGQTIVLYGGLVPHELLPVENGQVRIVSVLCYRVNAGLDR
jgi:hypothetical protein